MSNLKVEVFPELEGYTEYNTFSSPKEKDFIYFTNDTLLGRKCSKLMVVLHVLPTTCLVLRQVDNDQKGNYYDDFLINPHDPKNKYRIYHYVTNYIRPDKCNFCSKYKVHHEIPCPTGL